MELTDTLPHQLRAAWAVWERTHAERNCPITSPGGCRCECPDHGCADAIADIEAYHCPTCRDERYVTPRHLEPGDSGFGVAVPCTDCNSADEVERMQWRMLTAGSVPRDWWSTHTLYRLQKTALRAGLEQWLAEVRYARPFLVLSGPPGTGKSHGAVAVLRERVRDGVTGWFTPVVQFLDDLRATYDSRESIDDIERPLLAAGIAVLDDIGAQKDSEWTRERLFRVIEHRHANRKETVITTNLTPDAVPDDRLFSRVFGDRFAMVIRVEGQDHRYL